MDAQEHHHHRQVRLNLGVITASDTRTPETDSSGAIIRERLEAAGHRVGHYAIIRDDRVLLRRAVLDNLDGVDGVIVNGGTGIAARDTTFEALRGLLDKELDGFGELFRYLSYQEIGSAAFLSRATAGIARGRILVSLPGSPDACRLAMDKLLIPELGHMAHLLELGSK